MKRFLKILSVIVVVCIMFAVIATNVVAAAYEEKFYASWRGNGSYSGRDKTSDLVAVGSGETVKLTTKTEVEIDPNTTARAITATASFREKKWYGYSTLISYNIINGASWGNNGSTMSEISYTKSGSATASSTADYYCVGETTGQSSAYYNYFTFTVNYTVGS